MIVLVAAMLLLAALLRTAMEPVASPATVKKRAS
jgi:hypothetical protein